MLKCIAIDDEPLALTLISTYVARIPTLQMLHTFENAVAGAEFLRNNEIDLLFIDINMPDITGIDLVRSLTKKPMVIFTTAYKNFAYEGFELEALDYLLKPIDFNRFSKAVDKAVDYYSYKNNTGTPVHDESIYVYSEYRMVKIILSEVEYLESMEDYVKIHLTNDKMVLTLMAMKKLLEKLPADKFRRIHRSFAVAVSKVKSIQGRKVFLEDTSLPISDSHADFVKEWAK